MRTEFNNRLQLVENAHRRDEQPRTPLTPLRGGNNDRNQGQRDPRERLAEQIRGGQVVHNINFGEPIQVGFDNEALGIEDRQVIPRELGQREHRFEGFQGLKINIPQFQGKGDPEEYLDWESKIEMVFECRNYTEIQKVRVATLEFSDYALSWWNQLCSSRRRIGDRPVETWHELRSIMRKRYIPRHYYSELQLKLAGIKQGARSVEDFYRDMESTMSRANIVEDGEVTMARFLSGLNREIAHVVELHHVIDMDELLAKAIKVERQLKEARCLKGVSTSKGSWDKQEEDSKPKQGSTSTPKFEGSKEKEQLGSASKGMSLTPTSSNSRPRDIKCFKCQGRGHIQSQCPNRHTMLINDVGNIVEKEEEVVDHANLEKGEEISPEQDESSWI